MNSSDDFAGSVNLGNPVQLIIPEPAEKLIRLAGSRPTIILAPLPDDDPNQRQPDIRLSRDALEWEPKVRFEDGLTKTMEYLSELG